MRSLAAFGVSKNFAIDGAAIDQRFIDRLSIIELLERTAAWQMPVGFYLRRGLGHQFWRRDNVQLAPIVKTGTDTIMGILLDIQGLEFALLAANHDLTGTGLERALYRPGVFIFDIADVKHHIQLSWEDGRHHEDVIITWKPS